MSFSFQLANIPKYGSEAAEYDGAASVQIIINGYPDVTKRKLEQQTTIYNWIKSQQVEPAPYKAPPTLQEAIHHFNMPPAPAHFVATCDVDPKQAMYRVLYWMRQTNYPAMVMVKDAGSYYWAVISAYTTDADPKNQANINLNLIKIHIPYFVSQ